MKRCAFTLIELLVVIAVIGLLVSLLMPALAAVRRTARRAVCLGNLHQLAIAQTQYLADHDDRFWPYFQTEPNGQRWWFGFEPGGPGTGTDRPLDRRGGVLSSYVGTEDDAFNCPAFPYDSPEYYPKFERRAASYGYNLHLTVGPRHSADFAGRAGEVMVFVDAIHFDFHPGFNEGHYVLFNPSPTMSGYAHYRHDDAASVQFVDGHAESRRRRGLVYKQVVGADAANLCDAEDAGRMYGFDP